MRYIPTFVLYFWSWSHFIFFVAIFMIALECVVKKCHFGGYVLQLVLTYPWRHRNIAHMRPDSLKQGVVVCIVSDGQSKVNKQMLQVPSLVSLRYTQSYHPLLRLNFKCRWDAIKKVSPRTPSVERTSLHTYLSQSLIHRLPQRLKLTVSTGIHLMTLARCRQERTPSQLYSA